MCRARCAQGVAAWSCAGTHSHALLSLSTDSTAFVPRLSLQIFLVGTAHVSQRSAEEVRHLISLVKPGTVMVELCPARAARLRSERMGGMGAGGENSGGSQGRGAQSDVDFIKEALASLFDPGTTPGQQLFKLSLQVHEHVMRAGRQGVGRGSSALIAVSPSPLLPAPWERSSTFVVMSWHSRLL
jgi:hypothetical protein